MELRLGSNVELTAALAASIVKTSAPTTVSNHASASTARPAVRAFTEGEEKKSDSIYASQLTQFKPTIPSTDVESTCCFGKNNTKPKSCAIL